MITPVLSGQYLYQSFRHDPIEVRGGEVVGTPALAQPWAPVGTLDVRTDAVMGDVIGMLTFRPGVVLSVKGRIIEATSGVPASAELKAEGLGAVYQITGWFLPDDTHLVGSVLCLAGDLAKQPVGTIGPFILSPTH